MNFVDHFFSREDHYSLGVEEESGKLYLSIPVTIGVADYEEYYEISREEYDLFMRSRDDAVKFAESCRHQNEMDGRLIQKPGWNRGVPY